MCHVATQHQPVAETMTEAERSLRQMMHERNERYFTGFHFLIILVFTMGTMITGLGCSGGGGSSGMSAMVPPDPRVSTSLAEDCCRQCGGSRGGSNPFLTTSSDWSCQIPIDNKGMLETAAACFSTCQSRSQAHGAGQGVGADQGCGRDIDCKGDRICQNGRCVSP